MIAKVIEATEIEEEEAVVKMVTVAEEETEATHAAITEDMTGVSAL